MSLVKIENSGLTSLEVAEITGKRHADIMRDIKDEINKLGSEIGLSIFALSSYINSQNKEQPMYSLTKDGVLQLGARYDAKIRYALIQRMNQLEEKSKVPQNFREALLLAAEQQEIIEQQHKKVLEMKPKEEFYDEIIESKATIDIGTVAKVINKGIGRNTLFKILRDKKVLQYNNLPYQEYIDRGYFRCIESKFTKPDGTTNINIKTVVFQKGVDYINKLVAV